MKSIRLRDLKEQLDRILQEVQDGHSRYTINKRSSAAALISMADLKLFERLEQAAYIEQAKQGLAYVDELGSVDLVGVDQNTPYELFIAAHLEPMVTRFRQKERAAFLDYINAIGVNPHLEGASKVKGMLGLRRLNIGDYILLYKVEEKRPAVTVLAMVDRASL